MTPRDVLHAAVDAAELHRPGSHERNEPCVTAGLLSKTLGPHALDHAREVVRLLELADAFDESRGRLRLVR